MEGCCGWQQIRAKQLQAPKSKAWRGRWLQCMDGKSKIMAPILEVKYVQQLVKCDFGCPMQSFAQPFWKGQPEWRMELGKTLFELPARLQGVSPPPTFHEGSHMIPRYVPFKGNSGFQFYFHCSFPYASPFL